MRRSSFSALLVSFALSLPFFSACSCDGEGSACAAFGEACGAQCEDNLACVDGMYCGSDGTCTADCLKSDDPCPSGQVCGPRGKCVPDNGGQGGNGGSTGSFIGGSDLGGNTNQGGGCASIEVTFEPQIPTVVLLIDQSGSMTAQFGGGTRWDVLYSVLMDPNTGIVSTLQNQVRFGLALYTGTQQACPALTQVSIALGNYAAIDAAYSPQIPLSETPTGDSITAILPGIVAVPDPGPKVIVLATDGEPDTCEVPNPQMGQGEAIAAAQAAYAAGVSTYIISVGNDVGAQHQQDMANAGTGKPLDGSQGNAPYFPANDQAALISAFTTIINGVRSCVLDISGTVDPAKAGLGHVYVDGVEVGFNDANGWQLNTPTQIELLGTSCDAIQNGDHTVTGNFPCDAIIPQ